MSPNKVYSIRTVYGPNGNLEGKDLVSDYKRPHFEDSAKYNRRNAIVNAVYFLIMAAMIAVIVYAVYMHFA